MSNVKKLQMFCKKYILRSIKHLVVLNTHCYGRYKIYGLKMGIEHDIFGTGLRLITCSDFDLFMDKIGTYELCWALVS